MSEYSAGQPVERSTLGNHEQSEGDVFSHLMSQDRSRYFPLADHDQHVKP